MFHIERAGEKKLSQIYGSILTYYPRDSRANDVATIKNEFNYRIVIERYDGVKFRPLGDVRLSNN